MNTVLLDQFGEPTLRRLAVQVGLPGARVLDRDVLLVGLRTYFALQPDREPAAEPEPGGDVVDRLPPALGTETMAALLERQGLSEAAGRLRARLGPPADAGGGADAPPPPGRPPRP